MKLSSRTTLDDDVEGAMMVVAMLIAAVTGAIIGAAIVGVVWWLS